MTLHRRALSLLGNKANTITMESTTAENKAPTSASSSAKLKQVPLTYFKTTPVTVKNNTNGQGKKRRNSGSISSESPNKAQKTVKPFSVISHDNTDCATDRACKIRKLSFNKPGCGNDYEVSSTSEADAKNCRNSSGNFMDRFVRKLPQGSQQEISSTNEMFQEFHQVGHTDQSEDLKSLDASDATDDPDCFIVEYNKKNIALSANIFSCEAAEPDNGQSAGSSGGESKVVSAVDVQHSVVENGQSAGSSGGESNVVSVEDVQHSEVASAEDVQHSEVESAEDVQHSEVASAKDIQHSEIVVSDDEDNEVSGGSETGDVILSCVVPEPKGKSLESIEIDSVAINNQVKDSAAVIDISGCSLVEDVMNEDKVSQSEGLENEGCNESLNVGNDLVDSVLSSDDQDISCSLNTSLNSSSAADTSLLVCSTPAKKQGADVASPLATPISASSTKCASSTRKRTRQVGSAKKAEKESLKQKRMSEQLEKKRKLEEEKAEKQRLIREKKELKEKEKQEQKEKFEKEKQEKEKQKEDERKKKEEERIKKEEEKKKKQAAVEAKQEEKKKKEEERRLKEEEKLREEEEKKKKEEKSKQVFQNFFIKQKENASKVTTPKVSPGLFIPFELKKDMQLAPAVPRGALTGDKKQVLDHFLAHPQSCRKSYLEQLQHGDFRPHRTGRILRSNPKPDEDIEVVHDSEALKKVMHKVKLLQFHTDNRPPYYGTWRKTPALSSRNPWKKDNSFFDYDVDSDEEWEEEEPGESLSCSDGEDDKGEEGDEDEDGWMVPHGYLSEGEGCNEDDEVTPEKLKLQQLAKAKAWEEEQKRKLRIAPMVVVGCFFQNSPSPNMLGDVRQLYEFRAVVLTSVPIETQLFGNPEPEKSEEFHAEGVTMTPVQKKKGFKTQSVPNEAMPDLIRLVHKNTSGIKKLIKEFRSSWLAKSTQASPNQDGVPADSPTGDNLDVSSMNESMNQSLNVTGSEKQLADEISDDSDKAKEKGPTCSISKRQLELKITAIAVRERRPGFAKICWYVHDSILEQFSICSATLPIKTGKT